MTELERTRQQLDPTSSTGNRRFSLGIAGIALAYAISLTILGREGGSLFWGTLALLLTGAATALVAVATHPDRAPLTRNTHLIVHGFLVLAAVSSVIGQWGTNFHVQDDWAPIVLGLLVMALGAYRPPLEIIGFSLISSLFLGALVVFQAPEFDSDIPVFLYVQVATVPLLALGVAAAGYAGVMVTNLEHWHRIVREGRVRTDVKATAEIEQAVAQERIHVLETAVVPFFGRLLESGTITEADRRRAAELAAQLRNSIVAEANRSWLDHFAQHAMERWRLAEPRIVDPDRAANDMTPSQRAALRAFLVALYEEPAFQRDSLTVRLYRLTRVQRLRSQGILRGTLLITEAQFKNLYAPFLAVLRQVFISTQTVFEKGRLTVTFSYE